MSKKTCKNCGSTRFLEIKTVSRIITEFEENGKPLMFEGEEIVNLDIYCLVCHVPLEGRKERNENIFKI